MENQYEGLLPFLVITVTCSKHVIDLLVRGDM